MVKAQNDAGSLTTVCQVRIKKKSYPVLTIDTECAPEFLKQLSPETKAMDGQEVSLVCVVRAAPAPTIKWLRNTPEDASKFIPLMLTNDIKCSFDSETGKACLKIGDAYPQDSGSYICHASNAHGQAQSKTALTVERKSPLFCASAFFFDTQLKKRCFLSFVASIFGRGWAFS